MIVTGVATIGLGIQPSAPHQPRQDIGRPRDRRRHEASERDLSPMSGIEGAARERQGP
jgi:hypothetical protein